MVEDVCGKEGFALVGVRTDGHNYYRSWKCMWDFYNISRYSKSTLSSQWICEVYFAQITVNCTRERSIAMYDYCFPLIRNQWIDEGYVNKCVTSVRCQSNSDFIKASIYLFITNNFITNKDCFVFDFSPVVGVILVKTNGITARLKVTLRGTKYLVLRMCDHARRSTSTLTTELSMSCAVIPSRVHQSTSLCVMTLGSTILQRLTPMLIGKERRTLFMRATNDVSVSL